MKSFNTRLPEKLIEQIQALAWFKRSTIQSVTQTALEEFIDRRKDEVDRAVTEYRDKEEEL